MKIWASYLFLLSMVSPAFGQDKPVAYNNLSPGGRTAPDQLVHDALDKQYDIVDFELAKHAYTSPRPIAGSTPHTATADDGTALHGHVMLAYVVTLDGHAASPTVIKCTEPKLCRLAIEATLTWRFDVGTLDGKKISTVALQEFQF